MSNVTWKKQFDKFISGHYHKATVITIAISLAAVIILILTGYIKFNGAHQEIEIEIVIGTAIVTTGVGIINGLHKIVKRYNPDADERNVAIHPTTDKAYNYKLSIVAVPLIFCCIFIFAFRMFSSKDPSQNKNVCGSVSRYQSRRIYDTVKIYTSGALPDILSGVAKYDKQEIMNKLSDYQDSLAGTIIRPYELDSTCKASLMDSVRLLSARDKAFSDLIDSMTELTRDLNNNIRTSGDTLNILETMSKHNISDSAAIILYYFGNTSFGDPVPLAGFPLKLRYIAMSKKTNHVEVLKLHVDDNDFIDTLYLNSRK